MKQLIGLICVLLFSCQLLSQTKQDSAAIEMAARDYVEGWQSGDVDRVSKAIHSKLAKRQVRHDKSGQALVRPMGATLLKVATAANKGGVKSEDRTPGEPFTVDVWILDIDGDNTSAKTFNAKYGFMDYIHLAKMNGEWKIINVLWDWSPGNQ